MRSSRMAIRALHGAPDFGKILNGNVYVLNNWNRAALPPSSLPSGDGQ